MAEEEKNTPDTHASPFDAIRHEDEHGNEYWSARELGRILGYATNYRNFQKAIKKAQSACEQSRQAVSDHFAHVRKMIAVGKGGQRVIEDIHLSRYGAYLSVQNSDASKPIVALGQTYFTVQTRRQELADEEAFAALSEDQKRLVRRSQMAALNQQLATAAKKAGVVRPQDFAIFQNHGYRGLYGGETEDMIHARKSLQSQEKILDYMGSDELAYNAFRASLTKQKIEREQLQEKEQANVAHFEMGAEVRATIIRTGATLPEDLPTPAKSIQQLQQEELQRLQQGAQLPLFSLDEPPPSE